MTSRYYLPAGTASGANCDVQITPESAGWEYTSLKIITLHPTASHRFFTGDQEVIVVPLGGAVRVDLGDTELELAGRADVFAGSTDVAYVGIGRTVTLRSADGGRFAVCGARTARQLPFRHLPAESVPVEVRGAGAASRQVRNFGTPEALDAAKIIACEVLTPAGNWSSYPAHKHDEATETESVLEEIYYFEIAEGPHGEPGFGFMRTSSSPTAEIELLEEVHDKDTVLVPHGWHGPCVAAPGFDMYYLNVMAGPERAWNISDHPDQAFVRENWITQAIDPRLTVKDATS